MLYVIDIETNGLLKDLLTYKTFPYVLNDNAKLLSVNKVTPSELTVKNNSYPLSRKLYMYTNGKAKGIVANYIGFIQSDRGQKIVVEQGFINIK